MAEGHQAASGEFERTEPDSDLLARPTALQSAACSEQSTQYVPVLPH
jgi:hypothetical protein